MLFESPLDPAEAVRGEKSIFFCNLSTDLTLINTCLMHEIEKYAHKYVSQFIKKKNENGM